MPQVPDAIAGRYEPECLSACHCNLAGHRFLLQRQMNSTSWQHTSLRLPPLHSYTKPPRCKAHALTHTHKRTLIEARDDGGPAKVLLAVVCGQLGSLVERLRHCGVRRPGAVARRHRLWFRSGFREGTGRFMQACERSRMCGTKVLTPQPKGDVASAVSTSHT